jgi:hypothetical protein
MEKIKNGMGKRLLPHGCNYLLILSRDQSKMDPDRLNSLLVHHEELKNGKGFFYR